MHIVFLFFFFESPKSEVSASTNGDRALLKNRNLGGADETFLKGDSFTVLALGWRRALLSSTPAYFLKIWVNACLYLCLESGSTGNGVYLSTRYASCKQLLLPTALPSAPADHPWHPVSTAPSLGGHSNLCSPSLSKKHAVRPLCSMKQKDVLPTMHFLLSVFKHFFGLPARTFLGVNRQTSLTCTTCPKAFSAVSICCSSDILKKKQ